MLYKNQVFQFLYQTDILIGEGAFSQVFRVKRISDGTEYAMKKVKMMKLSEREKQNALNEVRILASIQHPNIIGYKEAFFEDATSCLCIIMEYADGGDILKLINNHKKKGTHFTEKEIWSYFIQMVRGIKALHDLKICHRDIKCANIFLTKEGIIKLGDLNVSKVNKKGMLHTQTGTPYYASPEVWKDKPYDSKSDIWSLGCVLYEMITLQPPFRAANMNGLYNKVLKGLYDPISSNYTFDLQMMVKNCLQVSPVARPNCEKILAMPGLLNHLSGTLERIDVQSDQSDFSLLNTIKVPRDLGQITERLPKPQYQIKRNSSLPPSQGSGLPEIKIKDNLIQVAQQVFDKRERIPGGLANNIVEERKRMPLAVIGEENVPMNRRDMEVTRSAEAHLNKSKASKIHEYNDQSPYLHESRTPHYQQNKSKALDLINYQNALQNHLNLPKIQAIKAGDITGVHGLPRIGRHGQENQVPTIYMSRGDGYQKQQVQQKKVLQQVYGAYQVPSYKRDGYSLDTNRNAPTRIY